VNVIVGAKAQTPSGHARSRRRQKLKPRSETRWIKENLRVRAVLGDNLIFMAAMRRGAVRREWEAAQFHSGLPWWLGERPTSDLGDEIARAGTARAWRAVACLCPHVGIGRSFELRDTRARCPGGAASRNSAGGSAARRSAAQRWSQRYTSCRCRARPIPAPRRRPLAFAWS